MKRWTTAVESAAKLHRAMKGLGTDDQAVYQTLEGKSKEQLDAIKDAFQQNYKSSLESWIQDDFSGASKERALALARGDKVSARVAQLKEADGYFSTDEKSIKEAFRGLDKKELQEVNGRIDADYKKSYGRTYNDAIARSQVSTSQFNAIKAARRGDEAAVVEHELRDTQNYMWGRADAANAVLERNRDKIPQIKEAYSREVHGSTDPAKAEKDFDKTLPEGDNNERVKANLQQRFDHADAYRLREAFNGFWGGDSKEVQTVLEDRPAEKRKKLELAYDDIEKKPPGSNALRERISEMSDPEERVETTYLLDSGTLTREMRFRRATRGWDTDVPEATKAVTGISKKEAAEFERNYLAQYGTSALDTARTELDTDDLFTVENALKGTPENAREQYQRMLEWQEYEKQGFSSLVRYFDPDSFRIMEEQTERMRRLAAANPHLNDVQVQAVADQFEVGANGVRDSKNALADGAANTAAGIVAGAVVVGTLGTATPLVVTMGAVAASGAVTRYGVKAIIKGDALGSEEVAKDVATSVAEGLAAGAGSRASSAVVEQVAKRAGGQAIRAEGREVLKEVVEELTDSAVSGGLQGAVTADWRNSPGAALRDVGVGVGVGALGGAAGSFAGQRVTARLAGNLEERVGEEVARRTRALDDELRMPGLSAEAKQAIRERAEREVEEVVQSETARGTRQVGVQITAAATSGAVNGAISTTTEYDFERGSFSDYLQKLGMGTTRGAFEAGLGGAATASAQRFASRGSAETPESSFDVANAPAERPRLSNRGDVVYLPREQLEHQYIEGRVRDGIPRERAEREARGVGAFTDRHAGIVYLPDTPRRQLSLEEGVQLGALAAHEVAHQRNGADERAALTVMERYLNRNRMESAVDPVTAQLVFSPALDPQNPRRLSPGEVDRYLRINYADENTDLAIAASPTLTFAPPAAVGPEGQAGDNTASRLRNDPGSERPPVTIDELERQFLRAAERYTPEQIDRIVGKIEQELSGIGVPLTSAEIRELLFHAASYADIESLAKFRERLDARFEYRPWMLVTNNAGTTADALAYLSSDRAKTIEGGNLPVISMNLLAQRLGARPKDSLSGSAEELGYLEDPRIGPRLKRQLSAERAPVPVVILDEPTLRYLRYRPLLVESLANDRVPVFAVPGLEGALGFGAIGREADIVRRIAELAPGVAEGLERGLGVGEALQAVLVFRYSQWVAKVNEPFIAQFQERVQQIYQNVVDTALAAAQRNYSGPSKFKGDNLNAFLVQLNSVNPMSRNGVKRFQRLLLDPQYGIARDLLLGENRQIVKEFEEVRRGPAGLRFEVLSDSAVEQQVTSQQVASRMNGSGRLTLPAAARPPRDVMAAVVDRDDKVLPSLRPAVHGIMKDTVTLVSAQQMVRTMRSLDQEIYRTARERGIPPENVVFVLPAREKSYALMAWMYRQANPTSPAVRNNRFISADALEAHAEYLRRLGGRPDSPTGNAEESTLSGAPRDPIGAVDPRRRTLVVVLDDFSGSGNSVRSVQSQLRLAPSVSADAGGTQVLHASVSATTRGRAGSESASRAKKQDHFSEADFISGIHVPTVTESATYQALSPVDKALVFLTLGDAGFNQTASMMAHVYGAPNNNVTLFQSTIAPGFTLREQSVKRDGAYWYMPQEVKTLLTGKDRSVLRGVLDRIESEIEKLRTADEQLGELHKLFASMQNAIRDFEEFRQIGELTPDIVAEFDEQARALLPDARRALEIEPRDEVGFAELRRAVELAYTSEYQRVENLSQGAAQPLRTLLLKLQAWTGAVRNEDEARRMQFLLEEISPFIDYPK